MRFIMFLAITFCSLSGENVLFAQIELLPARKDTEPVTRVADLNAIEHKRQTLSVQIEKAKETLQQVKTQTGESSVVQTEKASEQVETLVQLDAVLSQQRSAEAKQQELIEKRVESSSALEKIKKTGPDEQPPYSFLLVDSLNDDLIEKEKRSETNPSKLAAAQDAFTRAKQLATEKENARQLAKEAFDTQADQEKKQTLGENLVKAEQAAKVAAEVLKLRELDLANTKISIEIHETETEYVKEKIRWVSKNFVFTQADLNIRLIEIEKAEAKVERTLKTAELSLGSLEQSWMIAKQALDQGNGDKAVLAAKLETLRLARQARQAEIGFQNWQRQNLSENKTIWKDLYRLQSQETEYEELKILDTDFRTKLEDLDRDRKINLLSIEEYRRDLATGEERIRSTDPDQPQLLAEHQKQRAAIQETISTLDSRVAAIDIKIRLLNKLLIEIGLETQSVSASQRFQNLWNRIVSIWNTVVVSVDENPITIGKIISGLFLVIAGFWLSKFFSRLIGKRILPRFGTNPSAAAAFQSIAFYILIATFTLSALRLVNVPLTVFTFLGGAAAIGLGFGSQNVMKNFISGLIMLAERPIRVGDLVQVDTLTGTVERIGTRSTTVRTGNNMEIIVPNGTFLENNIVNWTLSDSNIRFQVNVGVAYGSPTREVSNLLKLAADEHGKVQKNPAPFVWFSEFGDNSLLFELHAWITQRTLSDRKVIESDLRFRIDNLFREAGIVIAFPQRDVHIDTTAPLDIRLLPPPNADEGGAHVSHDAA